MNKITFKTNGIRNNIEKQQIKHALDKIEGVQEVTVDRGESCIEIEYNNPASVLEIKECIRNTGVKVLGEEQF
ncbi:MAG: heavy metal transporter [Firmicutes bacterium HGW-Firmicutes-7]|nr:MAG: heavy metal transporter [Firmicutes bacterium HGW-Firmicutes-7]